VDDSVLGVDHCRMSYAGQRKNQATALLSKLFVFNAIGIYVAVEHWNISFLI
jgi:hypothetical protein